MAKAEVKQKGFFDKAMDFIEKIGNAMPDPVSLFIILAVVVVILSAILGSIGYGAVHPGTGKTIQVVNLLTKDGFRDMYSKAVANYSNFAPLGMVMVCIIGAAVAEKSGFLVTMMKQVMGDAKSWMVTFAILFVAINANGRRRLYCYAAAGSSYLYGHGAQPCFGHDCCLRRLRRRF